jgi:hypothetical protein
MSILILYIFPLFLSFLDPSSPGNLKKLNSDLHDIHNIMSQNIQEVLQRGEKLDGMDIYIYKYTINLEKKKKNEMFHCFFSFEIYFYFKC